MTVLKRYSSDDCTADFDCRAYQPVAGSKRCQHYLEGGACALATEFMCVEWLKANGHPVPEPHSGRTASLVQPGLFSTPTPTPAPEPQQHACATPAPSASKALPAPRGQMPEVPALRVVSKAPPAPRGQVPEAPALRVVSGALTAPKSHASETRGMRRASRAPTAPESEAPPAPVPVGPRAPITPEEIASFKALGVELCLDLEDVGPVWLVPHYTGQARKEITPEHASTLRLLLDAFPGARISAFQANPNHHKELRA